MGGDSHVIDFDSSFLIDCLDPATPEWARVLAWRASGEALQISAVAWGEVLCGPLKAEEEAYARRLFPTARPLERIDAERAAHLFNETGRRSKSFADCCIAACAIRAAASLATSNQADFERMVPHGLQLA
jgi:predicted nucleic acid-binding protein